MVNYSKMKNKNVIMGLFCFFLFLLPSLTFAQEGGEDIYINQLGFLPNVEKIASIHAVDEGDFLIRRTANNQIAFSGQLEKAAYWKSSGEKILIADFSKLQEEGEYYLEVPGGGKSSKFTISKDCFKNVLQATSKAYYYWRSAFPITKEFGGEWNRPLAHPDTVVFIHPSAASKKRPAGTAISAPGGWYDAGDYNKYVVNSGITCYSLMSAYDFSKQSFNSLNLNIPESNDYIPDILNEVYYNLKWMMSMQDPHDGGVYHKLTTANFAGEHMPHKVKNRKRYVVQKTTAATLNFAAVMAMSHRVLKKDYPKFADQCLLAAEKAWAWAGRYPVTFYEQEELNKKYDPDINTGAYDNKKIKDEFAWAASELFLSTKNNEYLHHAMNYYKTIHHIAVPSWGNTAMLGIYSLLNNRESIPLSDRKEFHILNRKLLKMADALVDSYLKSPNRTAFGNQEVHFKWGSNAIAANQGMLLLQAWRLTGKQMYYDAAYSNLDYILGRNATGYCFVTGFGHQNPKYPHHRISAADGVKEPVPGLLVGGASNMKLPAFQFPSKYSAKRYQDEYKCYLTNEVAINWNAPLVFLISGLSNNF